MRRVSGISIAMCLASACTADVGAVRHEVMDLVEPSAAACPESHELSVRAESDSDVEVATALFRLSDTHLDVLVHAAPDWELGDTYATIVTSDGVRVYSANEEPWATGYVALVHIAIPLDEAGLACGDVFKLVVQLNARATGTSTRVFASAVGLVRLGAPEDEWASYLHLCCDEPTTSWEPPPPPPPTGCTLTQGFWRNHTPWPVESLTIGAASYSEEELLALLDTAPKGDASITLGRQLVAALLNVENGATPIAAIDDAQAWMSGFAGKLPYGVPASTSAGQEATALADALADYNEGADGPGHCDEVEPEVSAVP